MRSVIALVPGDEVATAQREHGAKWLQWLASMQDQGRFLDGIPDVRPVRDAEFGPPGDDSPKWEITWGR